MDRSTLGSTHHQSGKFFQNESFQTISILFTSTKIFEHFRKSILSKQSKTSLEQNKLRNADILIQQETIRTNSSSQVTTPSLFDLHEIYNIYYLSTAIYNMMFYLTIGSTYFVKTRTYVALFCPHELSIIFSGVMCLELCPL